MRESNLLGVLDISKAACRDDLFGCSMGELSQGVRRFSPIRRYKQSGWGREMGGEVLKNYLD
jgi:hypothetical protein